jgi:energy-coupling factor transporter ATP-binding protein EcfA2
MYKLELYSNNNRYSVNVNLKTESKFVVIQGDSGTGKSTFISFVRLALANSGIKYKCDLPCQLLDGRYWKNDLQMNDTHLFLLDESFEPIYSKEFSELANLSSHYFIIVSRKTFGNLNYSDKDIYEFKFELFSKQMCWWLYPSYDTVNAKYMKPDVLITEDVKSGYEFFESFSGRFDVLCVKAGGKTNIAKCLSSFENKQIMLVLDKVSIGAQMIFLNPAIKSGKVQVLDIQSFEHMILISEMFNKGDEIAEKLNLSFLPLAGRNLEVYYSDLLEGLTRGLPCSYSKDELKWCYNKDCCCLMNHGGPCGYRTKGDKIKIILGKEWSRLWFAETES